MYHFTLTVDDNTANNISKPQNLSTITCSSIEDFERQLRKDAELYIIQDVSRMYLNGRHVGHEYESFFLREWWWPALKKYNYSNINLTLDPSGEIVSLDPHHLVDSRSLYSSSSLSTRKIFEDIAQKYATNYWSKNTVRETVNIAPGYSMKPVIEYVVDFTGRDVKNKTFSVRRIMKTTSYYRCRNEPMLSIWRNIAGGTSLLDAIWNAMIGAFKDYVRTIPSYAELLSPEDCAHLYKVIDEKYGAKGFSENAHMFNELREYFYHTQPGTFEAEGSMSFAALIRRNPRKYFVGPWLVDDRSDYMAQLNDLILERLCSNEFIDESISFMSESKPQRIFEYWWHENIGNNIKDLERYIKRHAGSQKARAELIRDIMDDYLDQSASFAQTVQSLVPYFPRLDSLAQALDEKKFEVFESDTELDAIAYETYRTHILSNPHIHRWFDYYLDEQQLKENEYRLVLNGEFLDGFYDSGEDNFLDDGAMFVSSAHETGFKEWISRHILDLYPSFNILLSSIGPDYAPYHRSLMADLTQYARSEQTFRFLVNKLSYVMSEEDYLDLYEALILREVESAGLDPRDITLVWDLDN